MRKCLILLTFLFFSVSVLKAQDKLMIVGVSPEIYLTHTVQPKETWYSLGRMYNLSPKEIAAFNHTSMSNTLKIEQEIKIPLQDANFSQDGRKAADEVLVPVYHTLQEKEWMYRLSVNYNKVPIENLEKWNQISNDQLRPGMDLIVGYLKVKPALSALAKSSKVSNPPIAVNKPATSVKQTPASEVAETNRPASGNTPASSSAGSNAPVVQPKEVVVQGKADSPAVEKTRPAESNVSVANNPTVDFKGGYFRRQYSKKGQDLSGNAGIFRSTSGWNDGKYYALMNDVPVGTIVKISFSSTNKSIYAKVLGALPEMKESVGLIIRLSDAAAAELGATLGKFYVDISY